MSEPMDDLAELPADGGESRVAGQRRDVSDSPLSEQMRIRRTKREALLESGRDPYPLGYPRTAALKEIRKRHLDLAIDTASGEVVATTGRIIFQRNSGKLCFATLQDGDGTQLQIMLSLDKVGASALEDWKRLVDIGDQVGITGEVISSKRGELSVLVSEWSMTAKALRPLPVAHRAMAEESRIRQRYVDLIMRPAAREIVETRAAVVRSLRDSFHRRGFTEVETPMLQLVHGGAAARPFVTHMNAIDTDLFLRIAPELFLKRCVVGGIDKVFEINRNFRNEGADSSHNPEFTMLEFYQAYGDYDSMAALLREVVQEATITATGSHVVTHADGSELDLGGQWRSITLFGSLSAALGDEVTVETSYERLVAFADKLELSVDPKWLPGKLVEELFEVTVVPGLREPTFVRDYPEDTSPLVRAHRSQRGLVEKWDLYVGGIELGTGYSELVDPVIQRERFEMQAKLAQKGDADAMPLDEDFLRAMEVGLPPSGGVGMGIDRLLMALTGLGIRETILFPLVRPE